MAKKLPRGFYRRGGVVWLRTDPVTGKPSTTRCRSLSAAKLYRDERERLAASPHYAASVQATVGKWVKETIKHKRARERSSGTLNMYEVKLGHALRIFGKDSPMASITPQAVDLFIETRKGEKVKNNTIARELTCLRQMLKLARRAGEYNLEPAAVMPVGFSGEYVPVKRFLPLEEVDQLIETLSPERAAWVCYAVATAGDVSDVERARPGDHDPATNTVLMRGTKNKSRTVRIPVLDALAGYFWFAYRRLPIKPWPRVSKDLPALTKKLGLGHITPKDLRRSVATWLIEGGADEALVSRFLRHKGGEMVRKVYGQPKAEVIGSLIAGQIQRKNVTDTHGPLGETGKRRGFKSRRVGSAGEVSRGKSGRNGRPVALSADADSAETLQLAIGEHRARVSAARAAEGDGC